MTLPAHGEQPDAAALLAKDIRPLLVEHCYDCHGDGAKKGGVAFDEGSDDALLANHELWDKVLVSVRSGLMPPPPKRDPLPKADADRLEHWIKYKAFALNPAAPDPGRVTLRRLNRVEYRNTVRELLGVDYRADEEFPADDTGHGFDNIGDVLSVSPLLLEKYLAAAQEVVADAVPMVPKVVAERYVGGRRFRRDGESSEKGGGDGRLQLSFYESSKVTAKLDVEHAGTYRVVLDVNVRGKYANGLVDSNLCQVTFSIDGEQVLKQDFGWEQGRKVEPGFERQWQPGGHTLEMTVKPLTDFEDRPGEMEVQLNGVRLQGPLDEKFWVRPKDYERFFGEGDNGNADPAHRRNRAAAILEPFVTRAYRRPVDRPTLDRLVDLAEHVYAEPGKTFEAGVAHAMVAVLASPRFLFREEFTEPTKPGEVFPLVDEYALASRLSYFLWSSMPDAELMRLASENKLRANLAAQVKRMLADDRAEEFVENFAGQWLQARDVESVQLEFRKLADRETLRRLNVRNDGGRQLRLGLQQEAERYFGHIVHEDRSVLELIDSDYTFLNERLADYYGIPDVKGTEFRKVTLPKDSPRGGVLTTGAVLMVTSNPTRTSPVKRGLFVLENFLGTPPPPAPPNIPSLDAAADTVKGRTPTLRESLEIHRENPSCSSCHNRMDPIGLAFENFSALGMWRDTDADQPVDPAGKLVTGETFKGVQELKRILVRDHRREFYGCLAEKLLTYALGRGVEHYDVETVDQIVAKMEADGGRFSTLLTGVIESAPFQRRREATDAAAPANKTAVSGVDQGSVKE